ncbi:NAD(P)/FAD-dependent oxidoreductase [Terasakiella sp. A23]|uniref:NAD(P)/FAD-dependent oxidoreductase n=1 Tax=Terasakiella sp. FCG-A23 TaxID=3080561 RepID=UPI002953023C|nr:NAD(P)/FAD-dependent oxidoreductase [Terasakiella sp. A23]MDV7341268.1 NAD(P)/FAD-dependent oxidoreductase [Terasakiella sp. A23]
MITTSKEKRLKIAIIGTGISGMSASWLLSLAHDVTIFEKDDRIGGHTNTVNANGTNVDTGFIVYNEKNYPNLIALFDHFGVDTHETDMSFGVSVGQGDFEYAGTDAFGMLAQKRNFFRPRFWKMVRDILRFYKEAPDLLAMDQMPNITLGEFLKQNNYSESFQRDHLLPMGAAIWSTPVDTMMDYPLEAFLRFCDNHGLLQLTDRPKWRTVVNGSCRYIDKLTRSYKGNIYLNRGAAKVWHDGGRVNVEDRNGTVEQFDHVVLACHADQALQMLSDADGAEKKLLSAFEYQPNKAILHTDKSLMPKNKKAWSSWNYLSEQINDKNDVCVTYWMNNLQHLKGDTDYFVTLNPTHMPADGKIIRSFLYHHPLFDREAVAAQRMLWNIQGKRNIWFCGSYFGHGFHEDGLQSGLAVAEALGGVRRPWMVENESGRINLPADWPTLIKKEAA